MPREEKPDLVVPDKRIVSVDEAKREVRQGRHRPPADFMKSFMTREEAVANLAETALAIGQKMYDQVSEELAENFEEQERRMVALIERELARRSLRGRVRAWLAQLGGASKPALVVDAVDALDPNVHSAAAESEDEIVQTVDDVPVMARHP